MMTAYGEKRAEQLAQEIAAERRRNETLAWELENFASMAELENETSAPRREPSPKLKPTLVDLQSAFDAAPFNGAGPSREFPLKPRHGYYSDEKPTDDE